MMIKRIICVALLLALMVSLISCDPAGFSYNEATLRSEVKSIEHINYDNDDAKELFEKRDKVKPFDFSKMQVIAVLPEEKNADIITDLSHMTLLMVWRHLDSPQGKSLKINYIDGSFDIICYEAEFSCQYDSSGNVSFFIGSTGGPYVKNLVEKYFNNSYNYI